jgi:hypothetical protein
LHDLGEPLSGRPRDLHVTYSQHRCQHCGTYFNADMDDSAMPHQVCEFHVLQQLARAVLHAVAKERKNLKATMPKLGRGRPSKATRKAGRRRVRRFKRVGKRLAKLFSPNLEKALTFLDDSLLPSTCNAVERGFRRHRRMQKTVYRVRTQAQISRRIALDMWRDARADPRQRTITTLHDARAEPQITL